MRSSPEITDPTADGISIRVRVRRATSTSKLEYGEPEDMVCTIVNWEVPAAGGAPRKHGSPQKRSLVNHFRCSDTTNETDAVAPTLYFQTRTNPGSTLEACCSIQSVSSFDSLDSSIGGDRQEKEPSMNVDASIVLTSSTKTYSIRNGRHRNRDNNKRKKNFSLPCSAIKTVEKICGMFRGHRLFFATGSKGSYDLEFENKNGLDIMMAFLQATLPLERFVNLETISPSKDASDTASYLSSLDLERLTERLAERESGETISERLKRSVGQVVSSIEEMSNSFCGNVCCHGHVMGAPVAPYVPRDEIRDSPPSPTKRKTTIHVEHCSNPLIEIDEEKSTQGSVVSDIEHGHNKRRSLREYQLPSELSIEMPE